MTKQEILDELGRIKDGLQGSNGVGKFGVDGACDDMSELIDEIRDGGVSNQYMSIH